eukprot:764507-Hanusia_phi.AAC.4
MPLQPLQARAPTTRQVTLSSSLLPADVAAADADEPSPSLHDSENSPKIELTPLSYIPGARVLVHIDRVTDASLSPKACSSHVPPSLSLPTHPPLFLLAPSCRHPSFPVLCSLLVLLPSSCFRLSSRSQVMVCMIREVLKASEEGNMSVWTHKLLMEGQSMCVRAGVPPFDMLAGAQLRRRPWEGTPCCSTTCSR